MIECNQGFHTKCVFVIYIYNTLYDDDDNTLYVVKHKSHTSQRAATLEGSMGQARAWPSRHKRALEREVKFLCFIWIICGCDEKRKSKVGAQHEVATHNHDCCCLCQVSSIAAVICVVVISHIISSHHQVVLRAGLPNQTNCCGSVQTDDAQQTTLHHSGQVKHRNTVSKRKRSSTT